MRLTFLLLILAALVGAQYRHDWITGSVVNISATEGPSAAAAYVYTIRAETHAENREFVIRLEAVPGLAGPSINAGESITFAPEGTRAWILFEGKEYQCRVLRQTLLQNPAGEPKSRAADGTAGESGASVTSGEQRPTIEFLPRR